LAKNERRVPFVEALVAAAIGITLEILNAALFENSHGGIALGVAVAVGGVLFSLQRLALEKSFEKELEPLKRLKDYVDLSSTVKYAELATIIASYAAITETEFKPVKQQILVETADQLRALEISKRSSTLSTSHYYNWLFQQFTQLHKKEYVHAVSLSSEEEWNDSDLEKNFLKVNIEAGKRGVDVSRIFVVKGSEISKFVSLPPIVAHTQESPIKLKGYWVRREQLEKYDAQLLLALGEGFIDFNGRVGLEDRFDPFGAARGDVTMLEEDLRKMKTQYENLMKMAVPLSTQLSH
jgi:hypothetical protein